MIFYLIYLFIYLLCWYKAQAALMYDTVMLVADTFNRMLRKKSDTFRTSGRKDASGAAGGGGGGGGNTSRSVECNNSREWVNAWEHGERVAKYVRKVTRQHPLSRNHAHRPFGLVG